MRFRNALYRLGFSVVTAASIASSERAEAQDLNAGFVVETMSALEQYSYVAGIVEGLATVSARGGDQGSLRQMCIYNWFYDEDDSMQNVLAAFAYFPDRLPGAVVQAMIAQRCPP
ncbi:MAG: hypothetical protein AAGI03_03085 [Pseudomonadota bacterium]